MKKKLVLWLTFLTLPINAIAKELRSLGTISDSLVGGPITMLNDFISGISLVAGVMLLLGAIVRYRKHKRNPMEVTLVSVFWMVILSLVLIALPFAYKLSESGVPLGF